jgi:hypothetical protein
MTGMKAIPLVATLLVLAFASAAQADSVICSSGAGAGQCANPQGLAVDASTSEAASGRLYVADQANDRVDVFAPGGTFEFSFGTSGTGKGQFDGPSAIAVDSASHDVYVVDFGHFRIERFDEDGNFVAMYGGGVNLTKAAEGKASEENVCTEASGDLCGVGRNGTEAGEFSSIFSVPILIGVDGSGVLYVVDSQGTQQAPKIRLQRLEAGGAPVSPQRILQEGGTATAIAVLPGGDFRLATERTGHGVYKYDAAGDEVPSSFIEAGNVGSLTLDGSGNLFVGELENVQGFPGTIIEYDTVGAPIRRFGYATLKTVPRGLAVPAGGSGVYASESSFDRVVKLDIPPAGPQFSARPCEAPSPKSASANLSAQVNPEGKATTVHFEYVDQHSFETEGGFASPNTVTTPESSSIGSDFALHTATAEAEGLTPETTYHCRAVASNSDSPGGATGPEGAFETGPPFEIKATWAAAVGSDTATLAAFVNPLGTAAEGYFEYVDQATFEASEFAEAKIAPLPPALLEFGGGEEPVTRSIAISGLAPNTVYRYRIHVDDHAVPPRHDEFGHSFRTFPSPLASGLPDGRAYEMVSPPQKNSAEVAVPGAPGGFVTETGQTAEFSKPEVAASSGESFTYTSFTSFADPEGAPGSSQYLARRSASGWTTANVSPFGSYHNPLFPPFRGFSSDLAFAGVVVSEPPLTSGCQQGVANLYLRDNASGALRCLTTEMPTVPAGKTFCTGYAGASADGSRAFFAANGAMAGAPAGEGFNLYEHSSAGLKLVSVLPNGNPAQPDPGNSFGAKGAGCSMNNLVPDSIATDGAKAFWTYVPSGVGASRLLARVNGTETIQLDVKQGGPGPAGGGVFNEATPDGSKVFFTDVNRLTADAQSNSLYRYDFDSEPHLQNLSAGGTTAGVLGLLGISKNGDRAYFAATGALTGSEENAKGELAETGRSNLYLWEEGAGLRFIAQLSGEGDSGSWSASTKFHTSRVSPDGAVLAFLSAAPLTGYDNTRRSESGCKFQDKGKFGGGPACLEAYLFDVEAPLADALACVSCNPSGSRPLGPSLLPTWTNPQEGPRYLAADGSRLLFESFDALTPLDENEKRDVYEAERPGTGSCSTTSSAYSPDSGLCLFLLSTGRDSDESYLLDASSSGSDAFFATRQRLVGWDKDDNYDVYDARVGGGFADPREETRCASGESCRGPAQSPPPAPAEQTSGFFGPGNLAPPKHCKKGKVRRRGKCVAKRHRKHRRAHSRKAKAKQHKGKRHKRGGKAKRAHATGGSRR